MQEMRRKKYEDIEITFVGMAYIIKAAMDLVNEAGDYVRNNVPNGAPPSWTTALQPWKWGEHQSISAKLTAYKKQIEKFTIQLQSTVSIASYAVSLAEMENALNASKALEQPEMSKFWSKRVGIDHTRVLMTELVEAAMDEFSSRFLTSARKKSKFLNEKIADMLDEPDVALQRLLSKR
jgi:hypothetical protein